MGNGILLVHHWEFERITGIKHHDISFFSKEDLISFINSLLLRYKLSYNNLKGVFETPYISTVSDYYYMDENQKYSYHAIANLYSSLIMNAEVFYKDNIIALAIDGGSDALIDENAPRKSMYIGAIKTIP